MKLLLNSTESFVSFMLSLVIYYLLFLAPTSKCQGQSYFDFDALPDLIPNSGYSYQAGLAGPYAGFDKGALILAGGANFPEALPWEGGEKTYYDEIFLLKEGEEWQLLAEKLPNKSAYGGAVPTSKGLFCFGGNTEKACLKETWFLQYDPSNHRVLKKKGPPLPQALSNFAYAKVNEYLYLAGGLHTLNGASKKVFWRLDLKSAKEWESLPSWTGPDRAFAIAVGQSNGVENCFYLFSGRQIAEDATMTVLKDAYRYSPTLKEWKQVGKDQSFPVMAGTAFPQGASGIIFSSGADGDQLLKAQQLNVQLNALSLEDTLLRKELETASLAHLNNHQGFGKKLYYFNTITERIVEIGQIPRDGQVTTSAIVSNQGVIIPSGEIKPGIRTPSSLIIKANPHPSDGPGLKGIDYGVIFLYFLLLAWMGYYFAKRQKNTDDYFKGGGRIPWWAAGLSIFGTALSAITFMAIPAKTYATDWAYFMLNMTIFLAAPLIIWLFIPFYANSKLTTAYEYLEKRFNIWVRLLGSLSFLLFQIGRMGIVLYLPSIALNVATGIDIFICIALMGMISLIYTIAGGIEAVIWTDVLQVIVLLGGALLSLFLISNSFENGFSDLIKTATQDHKFRVLNLSFSLKQPTLWVMLLGGIFSNLITYGTDQTMVQRYLSTSSVKAAKASVWTNAFLSIPATLIFFFLGTALYVFFKMQPLEMNPTLSINDAIFPWYILSQLPSGVSGLLIAGIFAAAMSSISSSMNSAATVYATDFHFRFNWTPSIQPLAIAKRATFFFGSLGLIFAIFMATWEIKSLWDEFQKVLGLIIGGLGGVFLLGILTKRANSTGALMGLVASVLVQLLLLYYQPVHLLLYTTTGVLSCFVFGYLGSLVFSRN